MAGAALSYQDFELTMTEWTVMIADVIEPVIDAVATAIPAMLGALTAVI
jgi:hypothetical protein